MREGVWSPCRSAGLASIFGGSGHWVAWVVDLHGEGKGSSGRVQVVGPPEGIVIVAASSRIRDGEVKREDVRLIRASRHARATAAKGLSE